MSGRLELLARDARRRWHRVDGVCCRGPLNGQVLGGGAPIANSTVTLWAASAGAPKQLAQARTGADGRFALAVPNAAGRRTPACTWSRRRTTRGQQGQRRQPGASR